MRNILITALISLIIWPFGLWAQDVSFVGTGKERVTVGERFRIVYEVNSQGKNFVGPNLGSLQALSGPNTSGEFSGLRLLGIVTMLWMSPD